MHTFLRHCTYSCAALRFSFYLRLIWLALVIASGTTLIVQLNDKIGGYLATPVTIDINVHYEPVMFFPAVVICNANSFKISTVTLPEWDMYDVINDVYNDSQLQRLPEGKYTAKLTKIDGIAFLKAAAHQLGDMLQFCRWPNGTQCRERDFEMILTDYGVCYKINYAKDREHILNGTNPGSGYGLYMILNTEDYEAMPGPQNTVGIKVLIYNQSDLPLVAEHGFDVAPGFQTSVGLKYSETRKLKINEGGQCGEAPLYFFPNDTYNRKLCTVDHKYITATNTCNCLSYNMPDDVGKYPMCTANQYFTCMIQALQSSTHVTEAECPQHCFNIEYQQYISFSELSEFKINSILEEGTSRKRRAMQKNYLRAREARSRNNVKEYTEDNRIVQDLLDVHDRIFNESLVPGTDLKEEVDLRLYNWTCFVDFVLPLIENPDFCSSEILDELLTKPGAALKETKYSTEIAILIKDFNASLSTLTTMSAEIGKYFDFVAEPSSDFEKVAYWVKQQLFIETIKQSLNKFTVETNVRMKRLETIDKQITEYLEIMDNVSTIAEGNYTDNLGRQLLGVQNCFTEFHNEFPIENQVVYTNMEYLKQDIEKSFRKGNGSCLLLLRRFEVRWTDFEEIVDQYRSNYTLMVNEIKDTCKLFQQIRGMEDLSPPVREQGALEYESIYEQLTGFKDGAHSKAEFANSVLTLARLLYFPGSIKLHFDDIIKHALKLKEVFQEAEQGVEYLLEHFNNTQYKDVLQLFFKNNEEEINMTVGISGRMVAVNECLPSLQEEMDKVQVTAEEIQDMYIKKFTDLKDHLQIYNDSLTLDNNFFKQNLLGLNIYLREMSIEVMHQRRSYNFWSLLSDIGGTLGLFMGASLLTVAEIADYIWGQIWYMLGYGESEYHKKPPKKGSPRSSSAPAHFSSNGINISAVSNGIGLPPGAPQVNGHANQMVENHRHRQYGGYDGDAEDDIDDDQFVDTIGRRYFGDSIRQHHSYKRSQGYLDWRRNWMATKLPNHAQTSQL